MVEIHEKKRQKNKNYEFYYALHFMQQHTRSIIGADEMKWKNGWMNIISTGKSG